VLDYLRDDSATHCVMMYLEGIEDGPHFIRSTRDITSKKPVVVLRGGLTESGGKAAASHTGAMAGSAAVFRAAARQSGVIICDTVEELVDLGACLAYLPLPRGRRVAVVTNAGGAGVLAADEVALSGLTLAELPESLLCALDQLMPSFWSRRNPMDFVAAGFGDAALRAIELVARCEAIDAILALNFIGVPGTGQEGTGVPRAGGLEGFSSWERSFVDSCAALMEETGKPIINVPDHHVEASAMGMDSRYAPVILASPRAAARALDRMAWYEWYKGPTKLSRKSN
jgi:acyl-CoA synthetase (NDP forming)